MRLKKYLRIISGLSIFALLFINPKSSFANDQRSIHVFVALCDNLNQNIVPVPRHLGDGEKPNTNLYWGALYGVKSFFTKEKEWKLVSEKSKTNSIILERCVFKHISENIFMIADAYKGIKIKQAIYDFLCASAGYDKDQMTIKSGSQTYSVKTGGSSDLLVYVGHNGLMDFQLERYPTQNDNMTRDAVVLSCASKYYFQRPVLKTGANPLVLTTGFMAPEAYTLKGTIDGWILKESRNKIRLRAANEYNKYQKCGLKAAKKLFDYTF